MPIAVMISIMKNMSIATPLTCFILNVYGERIGAISNKPEQAIFVDNTDRFVSLHTPISISLSCFSNFLSRIQPSNVPLTKKTVFY